MVADRMKKTYDLEKVTLLVLLEYIKTQEANISLGKDEFALSCNKIHEQGWKFRQTTCALPSGFNVLNFKVQNFYSNGNVYYEDQ